MRVCASCVCQPLQVSLFYSVFGYVYGLLGALDRRPSLDKSTFYQFFFWGGGVYLGCRHCFLSCCFGSFRVSFLLLLLLLLCVVWCVFVVSCCFAFRHSPLHTAVLYDASVIRVCRRRQSVLSPFSLLPKFFFPQSFKIRY